VGWFGPSAAQHVTLMSNAHILSLCLCVADAFVNSQEWTVSRRLQDIRLVISRAYLAFLSSS